MRVRVPADVDMADRIFAGLTARQLAILGAHGLVLLALYAVLGERLPLPVLGVVAVPVCLLGLVWATTSPEGRRGSRWRGALCATSPKPRRRVLAPEAIPESPAWIREEERWHRSSSRRSRAPTATWTSARTAPSRSVARRR